MTEAPARPVCEPLRTPPWALTSYRSSDGRERAGILRADGTLGELPGLPQSLITLLESWDRYRSELEALDPETLTIVEDPHLLGPLDYRPKIVCAGANYLDHLREMGVDSPPEGMAPYFFIKPTTSILVDGAPVPMPIGAQRIDWEAELAVVIGRRATRLSEDDAMDVVAGYLPFNDITDRGRLERTPSLAPPFRFDWMAAKGGDGFGPVGRGIVPAFLIDDPHQLRIRLWVGDRLQQNSSTSEMLHNIPQLIAAASHTFTLEPGDVLATGTPAGVGAGKGEFLRNGDVMTVEIEGVGRVTNPVRACAEPGQGSLSSENDGQQPLTIGG